MAYAALADYSSRMESAGQGEPGLRPSYEYYEMACNAFKESLRCNPYSSFAHLMAGRMMEYGLGEAEAGEAQYAAAERLNPSMFGTLQGRGGIGVPGGPCVVNVMTDWPEPTSTVAEPAARFVDVIVDAPPEAVIAVTESPAGTFSVTARVTPWFQNTRPEHEPTAIEKVCVPPCEAGADTV